MLMLPPASPYISEIVNEGSETAWDGVVHVCVKHYGPPEQITTDSGDEFSANWFAHLCTDADIRLVLKPKGSHACFAESMRVSSAFALIMSIYGVR